MGVGGINGHKFRERGGRDKGKRRKRKNCQMLPIYIVIDCTQNKKLFFINEGFGTRPSNFYILISFEKKGIRKNVKGNFIFSNLFPSFFTFRYR